VEGRKRPGFKGGKGVGLRRRISQDGSGGRYGRWMSFPHDGQTSASTSAQQSGNTSLIGIISSYSVRKARDPGRRRGRRFVNELLLRKSAPDSKHGDPEEGAAGGYLDDEQRGMFSNLFEDAAAMERWEQFVSQSEEEQRCIINETRATRSDDVEDISPSQFYKKIDKRIRILLNSKSDIYSLLGFLEPNFRKCPPEGLSLELKNSYQRLVAHGVAQFYNLQSHSEDRPDGTRILVVHPRKGSAIPPLSLAQYLERLHQKS